MFRNEEEINAWQNGVFCGSHGLTKTNPFPVESRLHSFWNDGFKMGKLAN